jgi:hypothetical protein
VERRENAGLSSKCNANNEQTKNERWQRSAATLPGVECQKFSRCEAPLESHRPKIAIDDQDRVAQAPADWGVYAESSANIERP